MVSTNNDLYPIGEGLTDELYEQFLDVLKEDTRHIQLHSLLTNLHPADIAVLIERLPVKKRNIILQHIPDDRLGDTISELHDETKESVLNNVPNEALAGVMETLESDDRADIVQSLNETRVTENPDDIITLSEAPLLVYPEDSAGGLMQLEVLALPGDWTVSEVLEFMRDHKEDLPVTLHRIFVVGYKMKHIGSISLSRLVRQPLDTHLRDIIRKDYVTVTPNMHQEDVSRLFEKYDLITCAVVDENEALLGVITIDDVLDVIIEERDADMMRAAGLEEGQDLFAPLITTSRKRFPWLFVNLITAVLASLVIAQFEGAIDQIVALAVLMPIVASMGGNAGTQTMTVAVRGLAMKQLTMQNAKDLLWKELRVGGFNGIVLAVLVGLGTIIVYDNITLGIVILVATIINHILAALAGIIIPVALEKFGKDPAVSSGVLLTTVTDVGGFFAFLGLAALFLI